MPSGKLDKKILLTNAGTTVAQNIIDYNEELQPLIYGADMNPFCYAATVLDGRFFTAPPFKKWPAFKKQLLEICRKEKIDLVISCSNDEELVMLGKNRRDFEKIGTKIMAPGNKALELCDDKLKCNEFVAGLGIKTPKTYLPSNLPKNVRFPLFLKERRGGGSAKTEKMNNKKDLAYFGSKYKGVIFQQFIKGPEYSVDMVLENRSKLIAAVCRERILAKNGLCVKTRILDNKKIISMASLIAGKIGLVGGANMQFIGDYFIEVNPRLPGGLGLISIAGFNMSKLAIKAFFDLPISEKEKKFKKVKVLRVWKDILYEK